MDIIKVKELSKEMTVFSRKAVEQAQNSSDRNVPQIFAIVLVALFGTLTPDRTSFWDAQQY